MNRDDTAKAIGWIYTNMNDYIKDVMNDAANKIIAEANTQLPNELKPDWELVAEYIRRSGSED